MPGRTESLPLPDGDTRQREAALLETLGLRCPGLTSRGDTQEAAGHRSDAFGRGAGHRSDAFGRGAGLERRVWEGTIPCWHGTRAASSPAWVWASRTDRRRQGPPDGAGQADPSPSV